MHSGRMRTARTLTGGCLRGCQVGHAWGGRGCVWLLGGVHGCCRGWGMHGCWGGMYGCRGACMAAGGCAWLPGGCAWLLGGMHGCQGHAWLPGGACGIGHVAHMPPPPPPRGQTDTCKNITFTNFVCGR